MPVQSRAAGGRGPGGGRARAPTLHLGSGHPAAPGHLPGCSRAEAYGMRRRALLRRASGGLLRSVMERLATPLGEEELGRSAMVFAPHPDDETLGCGGTILQKRRAGASMRIVFMT